MKIIVSIMFCLTSFSAFPSGTTKEAHVKHKQRAQIKEKDKQSVLEVFKINEKLHASFFKYDGKKIESHAKNLDTAIGKISNSEISNLLKYSQKKIKEITNKNSVENNNKLYHLVSLALIKVLTTYDLGGHYNVYRCPMVKKKWIQNSFKIEKVYNPYAPEMPHCGSKISNY